MQCAYWDKMNEDLEMKIEVLDSAASSTNQLDPPSAVDQNNSHELQVSFSSNSTGINQTLQ